MVSVVKTKVDFLKCVNYDSTSFYVNYEYVN